MSGRGLAVLTSILFVGAATYWLTGRVELSQEGERTAAKRLITADPNDFERLTFERDSGDRIEGVRTASGWEITAPYGHIRAQPGTWNSVAAAYADLANERTVTDAQGDLAVYGLAPPHLTVSAATGDGREFILELGTRDPTHSNRYARLDRGDVFLLPGESFKRLNVGLDELRDRRVFQFDEAKQIERIEFVRRAEQTAGGETKPGFRIEIEKSPDGTWQQTGAKYPVRQDHVAALESEVRSIAGRQFIDDPEHLGDYGLEPPWGELRVYSGDGTSQELLLGWVTNEAGDGGFFARRGEAPSVFVAHVHLITLLPDSEHGFQDARLYTGRATDLSAITIRSADESFRLENDSEGWHFAEPADVEADQLEVSKFIAKLKVIQGRSFPPPASAAGLDAPLQTIGFEYDSAAATEPADRSTIVIGSPAGGSSPAEYYARSDAGVVMTVRYDPEIRALLVTPFTFQSKHLFSFVPEAVQAVEVNLRGTRYVLERGDSTWRLAIPANMQLGSPADADTLLDILTEARAAAAVRPEPSLEVMELESPVLEVAVWGRGSASGPELLGRVTLGALKARESRQRFARVLGRADALFVEQRLIDDIRSLIEQFVVSEQ